MFTKLVSSLPVQVFLVFGVAYAVEDTCSACDCSCDTVEQYFDRADAVFFGEVVWEKLLDESDPLAGGRRVRRITFRVLQIWKGVVESEVSVLMPPDSGECGPDSPTWGDLFIVYATMDDDRESFVSWGCDGTSQYPESATCGVCDIAEFGHLGLEPMLEDGVDPCELSALCEPTTLCEPYSRTCGLSIFSFAAALVGLVGWSRGSGRYDRRPAGLRFHD